MKKFNFPLDNVLNYKNMVLEELKREHGIIISEIVRKEAEIALLEEEYRGSNDEFNRKKSEGMSILDATGYKRHIFIVQNRIKEEYLKLDALRQKEAAKRQEVVAAKVESSSIDKLKEKHIEVYNKSVMKEEEIFIEEFVSNKRAVAAT